MLFIIDTEAAKKELQVRIVGQERDHAIILSWNDSGPSGTVREDTPSDPQLAAKGQKCEVNEIFYPIYLRPKLKSPMLDPVAHTIIAELQQLEGPSSGAP